MKATREYVETPQNGSFVHLCHRVPEFRCPYHFHPEYELTLIEAGVGQRLVGDHLAPFGPGDLVLIGPNLPHTFFHPPGFDEGPQGAVAVVIFFQPEVAGALLTHAPEARAIRHLLDRGRQGLMFEPQVRAQAAALLRGIAGQEEPFARMMRLLEALHLLSCDRRAVPLASDGFHYSGNARQTERIERVCQWASRHFREPLTLEEAARRAHLSPAAFSRFFHRATNRPFTRFLNELRIGHACRLLLETERTVAEIAFESGFDTLSNFNRRFRQFKTTTPREYRATRAAFVSAPPGRKGRRGRS